MLLEDMRKNPYRVDPITVRRLTPDEKEASKTKYPNAEWEIVDGHKRFRNAELLHWETIPAIVLDISREEALETNYRKNRERGTVDPMLESLYFKHLYINLKMPAYKIAEHFNLTERYVRQVLSRIGIQPEAARKIVTQSIVGKPLTGKHLDAIAKAPPEKQAELADIIIEDKLSVKEAQKIVEAVEKGLPVEKAVEAAKTPEPPRSEVEIAKITCPECGATLIAIHYNGKHKIKVAMP